LDVMIPKTLRTRAPPTLWALAIIALTSLSGPALPPLPGRDADKVIHAVVYAVLGALLARAVRASARFGTAVVVLVAALLAAGYGASDELHQRAVPGRSSDPGDLVADAAGGLVGALTFTLIAARRHRRER
jgi:VanZ family protein